MGKVVSGIMVFPGDSDDEPSIDEGIDMSNKTCKSINIKAN
jgi:hypothetical protein